MKTHDWIMLVMCIVLAVSIFYPRLKAKPEPIKSGAGCYSVTYTDPEEAERALEELELTGYDPNGEKHYPTPFHIEYAHEVSARVARELQTISEQGGELCYVNITYLEKGGTLYDIHEAVIGVKP